ncbi:MAG: tRNA pseudouridine(38-40) synthase TruA [Lachnospiraceae bacterium]|nr:tRNA pseudouridine(38-40) synthase TruA [Lachnospiraceae bacterium]
MKRKILLTVSYDGSGYYGWQKQADKTYPTVQEAFENALSKFFRQEIVCIGASRTDRGVHAFGQRATIEVDTTVPTEKIPLALHSFLPEDIVVVDAIDVEGGFHPRYDCVNKTYEYKVYNEKFRNPTYRKYSEFNHKKLDIIAMNNVAQVLVGKHDFKAFAASGFSSKTSVRTIFAISVEKKDQFVVINVTGDGFLYNMVRIIAGTLIMVGEGKISKPQLEEILKSCDRTKAGKTAGPEGLTLVNIKYENY